MSLTEQETNLIQWIKATEKRMKEGLSCYLGIPGDNSILMANCIERLNNTISKIHEALGEDPGSDDESLPEVIAKMKKDYEERVEFLEKQNKEMKRIVEATGEMDRVGISISCDDFEREYGFPPSGLGSSARGMLYRLKKGN